MSYNEQLRCDYLTTNHEGALAWRMTPEWELYSTVVTTMGVEGKFYESGEDRVRRIADLVRKVEPGFVAQLAVYAREAMHLRSVPLLLLVELACCHHGDSLVSRAVSRTVQRADEITELLMCYQWRTGRKDLTGLSCQLRKGLAEAFNHFDEYQFAKYDRKDRKVTLRDALLLVHPKPKDERQKEIFRKILSDTLAAPYTWEVELSKTGKQRFSSDEERDEAKRATWQELIASGRLGYMAMLRNLRNLTYLCIDDESKAKVCEKLADTNEVRKSKQLPFRFLSAYMQLVNETDAEMRRPILRNSWAIKVESALRAKKQNIGHKVDMLKHGFYKVWRRKSSRYTPHTTLAQNAKIKGQLEYTCPKRHLYYRVLEDCHVDTLPEKVALKLRKLELMLANIEKKLDWLCLRARKVAEHQQKVILRERKRRSQRLRRLRVSWQQYLAPVLNALEEAAKETAANIPGFDKGTRVLLASDTSFSMCNPVSGGSSVMCYHIGLLLSMLMKHRCPQAVTGMFGDIWKTYDMPSGNVLQNTVDMLKHEGEVGYSTNGHLVIDWLIKKGKVMDKVMLFTDCQLWDSNWGGDSLQKSWDRYKEIAPDAKLYLFDLAGYGQSPVSMERDDVFCIAGWSDKVFDILAALERGNSAIDEIRRIVV